MHSLLVGNSKVLSYFQRKSNFRAMNWVVSYGHSQLLKFLFDQMTKHGESIRRVLDWEVQGGSGTSYISNLNEQIRLLMLSRYSGDVDFVKLLLKHCDVECITVSYFSYGTPLVAASGAGYLDIVDFLIKRSAAQISMNATEMAQLLFATLQVLVL